MKNLTLIIVFISISLSLKASHLRAGEIYYKRVAPFTITTGTVVSNVYNYSITVVKYFDDGPSIADRCVDTVYFGDGTKAPLARLNGSMTCQCQNGNTGIFCGEIIVNQPTYRVKKSVYSGVHTYPGPGIYTASSTDYNRSQGVVNIPNSGNTGFYIQALIIINALSATNSSPVFTNTPTGLADNVNCFYHNPGAVDADGDSLTYQLISCIGSAGSQVLNYTYPSGGASGYFYMNTLTGLLSWCVPQSIGKYNVAFEVIEWRKSGNTLIKIGSVMRDMEIIVNPGVLGINKLSGANITVSLFPNPATNLLTISTNEPAEVSLCSALGVVVYNESSTGLLEINTSAMPKGIYLVLVKSLTGQTTHKVILE